MADKTKIEWCDATLNYVNGCSLESPGCTHCYAMRQAHRFPVRQGLTVKTKGGMVWTGEVRQHEPALQQALSWRRGRKIFWNAHGDLFHPSVPDAWIDRQFEVFGQTPQHTHMVLTKRAERMRAYTTRPPEPGPQCWPLDNVWLGVSVEDQTRAEERIPDLIETPAAVRFLSCEPLLGPLDIRPWLKDIHWVIAGGESGQGARPCHPEWARSIRDQCAAAGVAFLWKQWGHWVPLRDYAGSGFWPTNAGGCCRLTIGGIRGDTGYPMQMVGKKAAGRELDGRTHDGFPS